MNINLTPIVLFVYNRPYHTEQTLNALFRNELASESILYIYCDGPKLNASDEIIKNIIEVRQIVKRKKWCKEVFIVESEINKGLYNSIKSGVSEIIEKYGSVIVLEDDLITSPAFLTFMNKSLDFYRDRKTVFSIGGYNMPQDKMQIPFDYSYDVFVCLRNESWGWATWKDRWSQIDWEVNCFESINENKQIQEAFNRGGDDVFEMLQKQQSGKLNIWSIQFTVAHFVNHAVAIIPTLSYIDNLGLDGSGVNCMPSDSLRNNILNENVEIRFLDILYEDKRIVNSFYNAYSKMKRPFWQKIINKLSRMFGGKNIFVLKKKIYV